MLPMTGKMMLEHICLLSLLQDGRLVQRKPITHGQLLLLCLPFERSKTSNIFCAVEGGILFIGEENLNQTSLDQVQLNLSFVHAFI